MMTRPVVPGSVGTAAFSNSSRIQQSSPRVIIPVGIAFSTTVCSSFWGPASVLHCDYDFLGFSLKTVTARYRHFRVVCVVAAVILSPHWLVKEKHESSMFFSSFFLFWDMVT